ncbi:AgmX/PglI C-terminal domain-containing protein [candidate division KSB1 bacterium]|nr:AgmX/PglI C-terminal domain-containing protein [candidate division KSB1 bacterium]
MEVQNENTFFSNKNAEEPANVISPQLMNMSNGRKSNPRKRIDLEPFEIPTLPKQFRKTFHERFDPRFLLLLLLSIILNVSLVVYLPAFLPSEYEKNMIRRMHRRFVDVILRGTEIETGTSGSSLKGQTWGKVTSKTQKDLSKMIADIVTGIVTSGDDLPDFSRLSDKVMTPEQLQEMLDSFDAISTQKEGPSALNDLDKQKVAEKVSDIGLLGIITQGSGYDNTEYVADIVNKTGTKNQNLNGILDQIKALQVPRLKRQFGWMNPDSIASGLKTGRIDSRVQKDFYETIPELAKVEETPITRNVGTNFEDSPLAGLNRLKAADGKSRSDEHIARVVASHNRAIQDCYKQVLKHQPGLNGKIIVRISIDVHGMVIFAEIVESTFNHPKIEQCILNRIRNWRDFGPCDPDYGVKTIKIPYKFGMD